MKKQKNAACQGLHFFHFHRSENEIVVPNLYPTVQATEEDYRCPMAEGMQMMQAVALQGVETRMCLFHGENHFTGFGG